MGKKMILFYILLLILMAKYIYNNKSSIKHIICRFLHVANPYTPIKSTDFPQQVWTNLATHTHIPELKIEKFLAIIIPSYNNSEWYTRNLDSIFNQKYTNYHVIYIDDNSPDNTGNLVQNYIDKHNLKHKITLIQNKTQMGALANIYNAVYSRDDQDIIVTLDGDDWLARDTALQTINDTYKDEKVWLTYGQYQHYPTKTIGICEKIPQQIIQENSFRNYKWSTSHIRTFYAWLFKKIKTEDLKLNNKFFNVSWDMAFMFPMMEMAGDNFCFIPDVLYQYNIVNPINDFKKRLTEQRAVEHIIRQRDKYQPLSKRPGSEILLRK